MGSYDSLIIDIPRWMENNSAELAEVLPRLIANAEMQIARELPARAFRAVTNGTLTQGSPHIPVPSDLLAPRYLQIAVGGVIQTLEFRTREWLIEYHPNPVSTGTPLYWGVDDAARYRVAPTPASPFAYDLGYRRRLPALVPQSPGNENWLTTDAYDLLLAHCLAGAARFLHAIGNNEVQPLIAIHDQECQRLLAQVAAVEATAQRDQFNPV